MSDHSSRSWAPWVVYLLGLGAIVWVGAGFVGHSAIALSMSVAMGLAYLLAAVEVRHYMGMTRGLSQALGQVPQPLTALGDWLQVLPTGLQSPVRQRIQGERAAMPGLSLTPYLIGLLVMLGMLGTFLGMVLTFKGAVFALEGSADLQAIRSALAAPIKGLGLAFGTSVAGVASSAMLGLMSAMVRRQRLQTVRRLDALIATDFYPFSVAHQRKASFQAMQDQAQALPEVAGQLQTLIANLESRSQTLDAQLLERQAHFHSEARAAYTGLGESVAKSLHEALTTSARIAGETIEPAVSSAMARVAQESQRLHTQVSEAVQRQLQEQSTQFSTATASAVASWTQAVEQQSQTHGQLVASLDQALAGFNAQFAESGQALANDFRAALNQSQAQHAQTEQQQQTAWQQTLQAQQQAQSELAAQWGQALDGLHASFEQGLNDVLTRVAQAANEAQTQQTQTQQTQQAAWVDALQTTAQALHDQWRLVSDQSAAQLQAVTQAMGESREQQASDEQAQRAAWTQALQTMSESLHGEWRAMSDQSAAQLQAVTQAMAESREQQVNDEQAQRAAWTQALQTMSETLHGEWRAMSDQSVAQQLAMTQALEQAAQSLQHSASSQAEHVQQDIQRLLDTSQTLVDQRAQAEAQWVSQQGERMDQLAALWRQELVALREDESARGRAAVERLGALQTQAAEQLATLGAALEEPMTRLLQTASEAPKAAAEVIAQLRQEMSQMAERDNTALRERTELVSHISELLQSVQHTTAQQRDAIESLVGSASTVLHQVSEQFTATLDAQTSRTEDAAAQLAGSAAELASLGEAFHHGVELFSASNTQLVDKLAQVEGAIQQSMARSDEQLAYYVAQAREVIDLSISSQQGIVEDLRRLRGPVKATTSGSAA